MSKLLEIEALTVELPAAVGPGVPLVRGVSFAVDRGELVGLVGESGSGKSLTALAILGLLPRPIRVASGRVLLDGRNLLELSEREMQRIRGARVGMIFQEPMTALNPVLDIGFQIAETVRAHEPVSRRQARAEARRLLELVAIPDAGRRLDDYPHQLSGGQRQRVMIAMALAAKPDLLLADEPTTALDVTIQAQILELLGRLRDELGLAVILITHDLAVVAETCERVLVMYGGQVVEEALSLQLFDHSLHPYTRGLLAALPRLGRPAPRGEMPSIEGQVPAAGQLPAGCAFHPRCTQAMPICARQEPELLALEAGRRSRCWLLAPAEDAA